MNSKNVVVGWSLILSLSGTCFAATPATQETITFRGAVVEDLCTPLPAKNGLKLHECPVLAHGKGISVQTVAPERSVSALDHRGVHLKLTSQQIEGHEAFAEQLILLDAANKPITSGNYLVTLTYP